MIYLLNRRYCPGEAWTNRVLGYAKGLSELGCQVTLVYCITDFARTPYDIQIPGVKVVKLWENDNWIEKKIRVLAYLHNLYRARKLLKSEDSVFVYGAEKYLLRVAYRAHAKVYAEVTEHPYIYNTKGVKGEQIIDKHTAKLGRLDGLCVISRHLYDYYTKCGISKEKVRVSNMFVDFDRFNIVKKSDATQYIAYCGVITYDKDGVDTLIKSFAIFHNVHPGYSLKLIGRAGSAETMQRLKDLANSLGLDNDIEFTGQVNPSQMPELLVNARMLALARPDNLQAQNGFPTKLGEYLATGNPVVVTRVGEIPLFLMDRENAILADPNNVEDFASKMIWVEDNYIEACKIGANGKKLALNEFYYKTQSEVLYELMNL